MPSSITSVRPPAPPRRGGSDFAPLLREIKDRGLLRRRTGHYTLSIAVTLAAYAACWVAVALVGDSWWQAALALPAALFTTRTTFLGHDAGHAQIAHNRRTHRILGLIFGNLLTGLSAGWWNDKHNRHHANPNHLDKDPDVGVGALVWTAEQTGDRRDGMIGWLTRNQARLFFPLLLLEGLNLKVSGIRDLRNRSPRERVIEAVLLGVHVAAYLGLLFTVMSPAKALVFIAIHQALLGLHLGCAFAPNHKGMPSPEPGQRWGHLHRQVLTSRNVRGGPVTDWMLGGLNYQIEHHLFPNMPRPNLRRAQPLVRVHCDRLGLSYTETGIWDSYAQALRHLHAVGAPLRAERR